MYETILPYLQFAVSGAFAGGVAWATMRVEMRYLRRDVDIVRFAVHSPKNPNNLTANASALSARVTVLETLEKRRRV